MDIYLKETKLLNYKAKGITDLIEGLTLDLDDKKEIAIRFYKYIRDGWRYDPYKLEFEEKSFAASYVFQKNAGHCIDKAILMVAFCRSVGIPARLHFAKVINHIATERVEEQLQTNEMVPHGMAELYLNDKWVKCTPAFNKSLCEKLNVDVLEFDGENDSLFQQYDREGGKYMEYVEDYGHFEDVPTTFIKDIIMKTYPHLFNEAGDFIAKIEQ